MQTPQFILGLDDELLVDEFACGGGMSEAIEQGTGRHVDIAVNHDEDACSMHAANHPQTEHHWKDVFEVCPRRATRGRAVGLLHLSPDCTHHSQARGGQPRSKKLRGLAWIGVRWAGVKRPRIITLENVKQILQWGPLIAKRCPETGRVVTLEQIKCPSTGRTISRVAAPGERVPVHLQHLVPDPKHAGRTWRAFVRALERLGYAVEARVLCAADYGAPTTRSRLFMVARCDGAPIVWPEPTHFKNPTKGQKRWRSAAECIDWSIPGKSIFEREKPLADATLRRVAHGMKRYVLESADPFLVQIANWSRDGVTSARDPRSTVTAWPRGGSHAVVAGKFAAVTAFVEQANGGFNATPARDAREPLSTSTATGSQQRLVTAHLATLRQNCVGEDLVNPVPTITSGGEHHALVEYTLSPDLEKGALRCAAFLIRYYGQGGQLGDMREPMSTSTTKDRLALVTVWLRGTPYVIVDIQLRMLTPRELYNANGFPATYIIDRGHDGRVFSKSTQVRMCGNAVPPPLGKAVIEANWKCQVLMRRAA